MTSFIEALQATSNEQEVNNAWFSELSKLEGATLTVPKKCDGILEVDGERVLIEYKYNQCLTKPAKLAAIVTQTCIYIKQMKADKKKPILPKAVLIATNNSFAICKVDEEFLSLLRLNKDVNWDAAASRPELNKKLLNKVKQKIEDKTLNFAIFPVGPDITAEDIKRLAFDSSLSSEMPKPNVGTKEPNEGKMWKKESSFLGKLANFFCK